MFQKGAFYLMILSKLESRILNNFPYPDSLSDHGFRDQSV